MSVLLVPLSVTVVIWSRWMLRTVPFSFKKKLAPSWDGAEEAASTGVGGTTVGSVEAAGANDPVGPWACAGAYGIGTMWSSFHYTMSFSHRRLQRTVPCPLREANHHHPTPGTRLSPSRLYPVS